MAGSKRPQQRKPYSKTRQAAEEAARRHKARRRQVAGLVGLAAVVVIGVLVTLLDGGDDTEVATNAPSTVTPTTAAGGSAAARPCVPVADQLPQGAPPVPVREGPPPTELVKQDLREGTGAEVAPGATLTVNYIGVACSTGKIFDSSYSRGQPATFSLSGVIKGWQDGIPGMRVGGQRLLGIPPNQAYGPTGSPPTIGPDETLWFVVDVLDAR